MPRINAGDFQRIRECTEKLCEPLAAEDYVVQSMPDVSPTKWHLAHVSWFFETFVLKPHTDDYRPRRPEFEYLFNSYYNTVGEPFPRPRRGLLTRPTVAEVYDYRRRVDDAMVRLLERGSLDEAGWAGIAELGLHHEQQHQELLLMDIKHVLSCNPLFPAYREPLPRPDGRDVSPQEWIPFPEGRHAIGFDGPGFSFDNERPRHEVLLAPFLIASRLVTNGEYLEFVADGGYRSATLWLADGWSTALREGWQAPLYWVRRDGEWFEFALDGLRPLDRSAPVCHVSFYEADAFARWSGSRLPREEEWETAAFGQPVAGNFLESSLLHPRAANGANGNGRLRQMLGDTWEWTASPYTAYPGFRPAEGALGEYNGKFMCSQQVLRGGACVTPGSHVRPTYRNFFYPHCRWQFSGIRLARDADTRARAASE